jgi:HEPN domain-containing protein
MGAAFGRRFPCGNGLRLPTMSIDRLAPVTTPDNPRLADAWLIEQAWRFAAAADAYTTRGHIADPHTVSFLLGRALELALKAYLVRHHSTEKELRKLGHSLSGLLDRASTHGFGVSTGLTDIQVRAIKLLSEDYADKYFEYPELRPYAGYSESIIRQATHEVLREVIIAMWGADYYAHMLKDEHASINGVTVAPDARYD